MSDNFVTITGADICLEDTVVSDKNLIIKNGLIHAVSDEVHGEQISFPSDHTIIPGMIDCHIHGAAGADVMDATPEALQTLSKALYKEGTTGFLATTMTESKAAIKSALEVVATFSAQDDNDHILGVHLEGPFLSAKRMGAQRGELIVSPDNALFDEFQLSANGLIKLLTIAPEVEGALAFIEYIVSKGVVASIGHTDATCKETQAAIGSGATHATHLFNAMRGIHHREPGTAGAILMSDKVTAELICDGIHLNPDIVQFSYSVKGGDCLVLVTDAMRAKCMGEGQFDLGGQTVTVKNNEARLESGTLAGSVLTMNQALKNLMSFTNIDLPSAVKLTSVNPAKILGFFDSRGSIAPGKRADIVILDKEKRVVDTRVLGQSVI